MNPNRNVACVIAAIIGSALSGASHAANSDTPAAPDVLKEVVVTAQRRSQNAQNVPISMQVLTANTLQQLNAATFDDYVKYLPNVTAPANGPGQSNVYMRGLSASSVRQQSGGVIDPFPNVAIYLDEQSGQLPDRNLDVYAADLERIEILEGPQGTLFGASAEAGVIRYITNKPKLNVTEGSVEASYGITAHGDPNTSLQAVLNLPLVKDTLAVRAVVYNDRRGGYIDNVPATFTRKDTDLGIHYADYPTGCGSNSTPAGPPCQVPPGSPVINNADVAGRAINPVTYQGIRAEALYKITDDWDLLVTQSYQNLDTEGVFYQQPFASDGAALQPLQVTVFNPSHDKDRFENTAWTVSGKVGDLKVIYTGAYLVRNVDQVADYTNYARSVYADYYQCYGPNTAKNSLVSTCFSPRTIWHDIARNSHLSNEFRLGTPDEWRTRGLIGAYFDENKLYDSFDFAYKTIPNCTSNATPGTPGNGNTGCLSDLGTAPGATVQFPGVQSDISGFYEDALRQVDQLALFGSVSFDLIPKILTITAGTRHFRFDNSFKGSITSDFGCFQAGVQPTGCIVGANNLDNRHLSDVESGFSSRANLTWHIGSDVMLYYTWSQGFRPGGFNRVSSCHIKGPDLINQFCIPQSYQPDTLINNELGWKTEFLDHRVRWNGAIYQENWDNAQVQFFSPGETGLLVFETNGQNFRIRGIETSIAALLTTGLTIQGAADWNQSVQTNSPSLPDNNPASVNYGKLVTESCSGATGSVSCTQLTNLYGPVGSPSANSPPIQFNLRLRYAWEMNDYSYFVQAGVTHTGHSFTQTGNGPALTSAGISTGFTRFENPAYSEFDASAGVAKDSWMLHVYCQNLLNSNASLYKNTTQFVVGETPLRPRVIGMTFGYSF